MLSEISKGPNLQKFCSKSCKFIIILKLAVLNLCDLYKMLIEVSFNIHGQGRGQENWIPLEAQKKIAWIWQMKTEDSLLNVRKS